MAVTGKPIELDVLARDSTGRLFNVEVQVQRHPRWSTRSAFYLSRMLSKQIEAGQSCVALKPVVGVHLLDFDLFESHPGALWQVEMRDRRHPAVRLGDELTLDVFELPEADRLARMRDDWGGEAGAGAGTGADVDASVDGDVVNATSRPERLDRVPQALEGGPRDVRPQLPTCAAGDEEAAGCHYPW